MSTSVTLPALGESVTEGTVSRWLKQVGDTVEADEPLLEVSTDKVDTEIPSPTSGVLLEIRAQEDETVEVGAVLAVIGDASEAERAADSGGDDQDDAGSRHRGGAEQPEPTRAPRPDAERIGAGGAGPAGADEPGQPADGEPASDGGQPVRGRCRQRNRGHPAGAGRERHRGHGEPLAQAGR